MSICAFGFIIQVLCSLLFFAPTVSRKLFPDRDEDGIDIVALGVTQFVNERELKGISGMDFVTRIDVFDEFHELATILLEASEY